MEPSKVLDLFHLSAAFDQHRQPLPQGPQGVPAGNQEIHALLNETNGALLPDPALFCRN
jgi:hypothetical protein